MTTEPAKGSRYQFVDRTISLLRSRKSAQTESAERLRGRSPIADTAKEAPSDRIRPGIFAEAEISGLRFGYAAPDGPSAPVLGAPSAAGSKDPVVENIFAAPNPAARMERARHAKAGRQRPGFA